VEERIGGPSGDDRHNRYDSESYKKDVPSGPPRLRPRSAKHGPHSPPFERLCIRIHECLTLMVRRLDAQIQKRT
jgi:hypothetical protein